VPDREFSHRLVAVEDVLRLLDEAEPLSSDAIARRLELGRLEARMVLLQAHWHGLVHASRRGEWTISERGRQALAGELIRPTIPEYLTRLRVSASELVWRRRLRPGHIARGGVSLALGAAVCVAGVAVASSSLPISGPPTIPQSHVRHARHHRHRRTRFGQTALASTVVTTSRPIVSVVRTPSPRHQLAQGNQRARKTSTQRARTSARHQHRHRRTGTVSATSRGTAPGS
jgi:hypothetical protein